MFSRPKPQQPGQHDTPHATPHHGTDHTTMRRRSPRRHAVVAHPQHQRHSSWSVDDERRVRPSEAPVLLRPQGAVKQARWPREPRRTPPHPTAVERTKARLEQRSLREQWLSPSPRGRSDGDPWWDSPSLHDATAVVHRSHSSRAIHRSLSLRPATSARVNGAAEKMSAVFERLSSPKGAAKPKAAAPVRSQQPTSPLAGVDVHDVGSAIAALQNIAEMAEDVTTIVEAGGVDVVTQIMVRHGGNRAIQACGLAALRILLRSPHKASPPQQ